MHRRKRNRAAGWLLSLGRDRRSYHVSGCHQINFDRILDLQEQRARIFHSPLGVWNREVNCSGPVVGHHLYIGWDRDFMVDAMNVKHSVDSDRGLSLTRDGSLDSVGMKNDFRITAAFKNFLVHLV